MNEFILSKLIEYYKYNAGHVKYYPNHHDFELVEYSVVNAYIKDDTYVVGDTTRGHHLFVNINGNDYYCKTQTEFFLLKIVGNPEEPTITPPAFSKIAPILFFQDIPSEKLPLETLYKMFNLGAIDFTNATIMPSYLGKLHRINLMFNERKQEFYTTDVISKRLWKHSDQ